MGLFDQDRGKGRITSYACTVCDASIALERVHTITRIPEDETLINMVYECSCRATNAVAKFPLNIAALTTLFGSREAVALPYTRDLVEAAATPPVRAVPRRQALIEAWEWECAQLYGPDEFLAFCRGPRHRDQEVRDGFREAWGTDAP